MIQKNSFFAVLVIGISFSMLEAGELSHGYNLRPRRNSSSSSFVATTPTETSKQFFGTEAHYKSIYDLSRTELAGIVASLLYLDTEPLYNCIPKTWWKYTGMPDAVRLAKIAAKHS